MQWEVTLLKKLSLTFVDRPNVFPLTLLGITQGSADVSPLLLYRNTNMLFVSRSLFSPEVVP